MIKGRLVSVLFEEKLLVASDKIFDFLNSFKIRELIIGVLVGSKTVSRIRVNNIFAVSSSLCAAHSGNNDVF